MNAERVRSLLLALPHVVETVQWGDNVVFWVGDKAIGGKMFAVLPLDAAPGAPGRASQPLLSFAAASPAAYDELLEREGLMPAPYFARIKWVSVTGWEALSQSEWQERLTAAYARVLAQHTPKVRAILALPAREQQRQIIARRKLLAEKAAAQPRRSKKSGAIAAQPAGRPKTGADATQISRGVKATTPKGKAQAAAAARARSGD